MKKYLIRGTKKPLLTKKGLCFLSFEGQCLTDTGVRLLDVQQGTYRSGKVGDMGLAWRTAMRHVPAIEEHGDVGIVRVPLTMCGTHRRRPFAKFIVAGLGEEDNIAGTTWIVA